MTLPSASLVTPTLRPLPLCRAVFKLSCSPKADKRQALLQFLEAAAASGEPDALALRQTKGAELFLLVRAARDAREGQATAVAPADEMLSNLVRAVAALATCPANRRYILDAGCLEPVVEALAAPQPQLALAAVQVRCAWWGCAGFISPCAVHVALCGFALELGLHG